MHGDKWAHLGSRMDAVPFNERMDRLEFDFGANTSGLATVTDEVSFVWIKRFLLSDT